MKHRKGFLFIAFLFSLLPLKGFSERVRDSVHIFHKKNDTVFADFERNLRLLANPDIFGLGEENYLWSDGSGQSYLDPVFDGERQKLIRCQRRYAPPSYHNIQQKEVLWVSLKHEEDGFLQGHIKLCAPRPLAPVSWTWKKNGEVLDEKGCHLDLIYKIAEGNSEQNCIIECSAVIDEEPVEASVILTFWKQGKESKAETERSEILLYFISFFHHASDTIFFEQEPEDGNCNVEFSVATRITDLMGLNEAIVFEDEKDKSVESYDFYFIDSLPFSLFYEYAGRIVGTRTLIDGEGEETTQTDTLTLFTGINPWIRSDADSIWIIYPQYAYSGLGGDTAFCMDYATVLPASEDTILTYNLGPYNRGIYASYQWKNGYDSVISRDSVCHYTFGMLDSVSPNRYQGVLLVRVATDSIWKDSMYTYCDTCFTYDTISIRYIRNGYAAEVYDANVFLPRDTVLCAHEDLQLCMSDTDYRAWWLDADSILLPFGSDTARYTVEGKRGTDGYGANTDTRQKDRYYLKFSHRLCPWESIDTLDVVNIVRPQADIEVSDTVICRDEPVTIQAWHNLVYREAYTIDWRGAPNATGDGAVAGEDTSACTFRVGGDYTIGFYVRQAYDVCGYDTAYDTISVLRSDPAMTDINLVSDTVLCKNKKTKVTLNIDVSVARRYNTAYAWRLGPVPTEEQEEEGLVKDSVISRKPVLEIKDEGTYNVTLLDTLGCKNRAGISVVFDECIPAIHIPNVFTPNGDGINDELKFTQLEKCTDIEITVVDRWGQPVLNSRVESVEDFSWNGCYKNGSRKLPDGPYFYMVSYKNLFGKSKVQSGSITILGAGGN